ncbi:MAG: efflux RND transporter periplasmic adaptor subunit [Gammaproteobacteria bacterium]|nr:efflux RND transporter periplasmic adaptor subunit [Gammaproteobacteria bacterium]
MSEKETDLEQKLQDLKIDRTGSARGRRPWGLFIALALIVGVGAVAASWFWFGRDRPLEVQSSVARTPTASNVEGAVLDGTGYVVARRQATVSSKATGKVVDVFIEEGMIVEEGQLLATLDDSLQRTQFELSKAQLEETQARLKELDIQIEQASLDVGRITKLVEKNHASQSELDRARLTLNGLNAQKNRLEKSIDVSQVALDLQQQYLDDMEIRAPFDGIVIAKAAQPGEVISPVSGGGGFTRTGICTIVDMDSIEVEVDVNEKYINRVSPDQPATVTLNSYPDTRLPAEVIAIIPTADRAQSTVRVRIGFLDRDERVLPDMGVSVSFLEEGTETVRQELPAGVEVPTTAIFGSEDNKYVWVLEDKSVFRRSVSTAATSGSRTVVSSGLERGELVVANLSPEKEALLSNGQSVTVAD